MEGGREKGGREEDKGEAFGGRKAIFDVQLMGVWRMYDEYMMNV